MRGFRVHVKVSRPAAHSSRLISTRQQPPKRPSASPAEDVAGSQCHYSPALCLPLAENQRLCSGATCPNFAGVLAALAAAPRPAGVDFAWGGSRLLGHIHPVRALDKSSAFTSSTPEVQTKQLTMTPVGSPPSSARPRGKGVDSHAPCCASG